ncbi:MAG: hypothetical protein OFPI_03930 [Osedax symbiont Rs2]|nr:MAG: hypothetical protein OFPI_03930 [Osedax symbiont Rs2]
MINLYLYKKNRINTTIGILCISLFACATTVAHEMTNSSAQVILRDGQLEIRLLVDRKEWQRKLHDANGWLTGRTNALLTAQMSGAEITATLTKLLVNHTKVIVNQQRLLLRLDKTPNNSLNNEHDLIQFRLSSAHSFSSLESLLVAFPASLGDVYVSVVRPKYQLINAGKAYQFDF